MNGPSPGGDLEVPRSRRAVLRAATALTGIGGTAAVVAACNTRRPKPPPAATPGASKNELRADVAILQAALDVEHAAIFAYAASLPLLSGTTAAAAQQFLAQEYAHASELSGLIRGGGGKPHPPNQSYPLGRPTTTAEVLALLHMIESISIRTYLDAIPRLASGIVRSTVASVLANEAEHISVLRGSLGAPAVPSAFVTGAE